MWGKPGQLRANSYNPNRVFGPEMALLKRSILETGWTQPIVVRLPKGAPRPLGQVETMLEAVRELFGDQAAAQLATRVQEKLRVEQVGEIVDGFHRYTLASRDPDIQAASEGLAPMVYVDIDDCHQMAATVRHNRARGQHGVLAMGKILRDMRERGMSDAEIRSELGMEQEEVERLTELRGSPTTAGRDHFGKAWKPTAGEPDAAR
jgi:ParB-like chromosome segregation protein Spo0J